MRIEILARAFRLHLALLCAIDDLTKDYVLEHRLAGNAQSAFEQSDLESLPSFAHAN